MSAAALLADLHEEGIHVASDGDGLRVRAVPGVSLDMHSARIKDAKPAILAELRLRERIVAAATAEPAEFDRSEYDLLWQEWHRAQEQSP